MRLLTYCTGIWQENIHNLFGFCFCCMEIIWFCKISCLQVCKNLKIQKTKKFKRNGNSRGSTPCQYYLKATNFNLFIWLQWLYGMQRLVCIRILFNEKRSPIRNAKSDLLILFHDQVIIKILLFTKLTWNQISALAFSKIAITQTNAHSMAIQWHSIVHNWSVSFRFKVIVINVVSINFMASRGTPGPANM